MDHVAEIPRPSFGHASRGLVFLLGLLGLVVVVVMGAAVLIARPLAARPAGPQPPLALSAGQVGPASPAGTSTLSRRQTTVLVLNGNGITGAAHAAAAVVGHAGYTVRSVGNASTIGYSQSIVMFRAGFRPEAMRFARDLGVRITGPLDGLRIGAVHGAKLVYILGS